MEEAPLDKIIEKRFIFRRGLKSREHKENSIEAIKAAVNLEPLAVEFDVMYDGKEVRTGHPPQKPQDRLEDVLLLFDGRKTYPKVDIKSTRDNIMHTIDAVLDVINHCNLNFVLVNIGQIKEKGKIIDGNIIMWAQNYLAEKVRDNPKIRLNIDLAKYVGRGRRPDERTRSHVKRLGNVVYSISPEIHEEDAEEIVRFAEEFRIHNVHFWLRIWPDEPNPKVAESTIRKMLKLEKKYPNIKISFNINPTYIKKDI